MNWIYWRAALMAFFIGVLKGATFTAFLVIITGVFSYAFWILLAPLQWGPYHTALIALLFGVGVGVPYTIAFVAYSYEAIAALRAEST